MMYNTIEINKLHQLELLRAAEQRRLADTAREVRRSPVQTTSIASPKSVLDEMGRGLMALGLFKDSSEEKRTAW